MAGTTTTNTVEIIVFQPIPNELCYFFMENRISEKEFSVVVSHLLPNVVAFDEIKSGVTLTAYFQPIPF